MLLRRIFDDLGLGVGNRYVSRYKRQIGISELNTISVTFDPGIYYCQRDMSASGHYCCEVIGSSGVVFGGHCRLWTYHNGRSMFMDLLRFSERCSVLHSSPLGDR